MEKTLLRIFQREIVRQCEFCLMAAKDLENALQVSDGDRVWYSVQALLIAAGNVSKILWPNRANIAGRGEILRRELGIGDESLIQPRSFRNHFEHFDERLEDWINSSERKNFADSNIGPTGSIVGLEQGDYLRNFDTTEFAVNFRGDVYFLRGLLEEIEQLNARSKIEAEKPSWD